MTRRRKPAVTLAVAPSLSPNREIALVEVPDPYEAGRRRVVARNLLSHPSSWMYARGMLDDAQHAASLRIMQLYEQAEIGGSRGIDYSRVRVDGGQLADPLAEDVYGARRALVGVRRATGETGYVIVMAVMGEGVTIERLARERPSLSRGLTGKRAEGYISGRLREALDDLVRHWGMVAVGRKRARLRVDREANVTGPQAEWTIGGRFGDLEPVIPRAAKKDGQ